MKLQNKEENSSQIMYKAIYHHKSKGIIHILDDVDDKWQQYPVSDFTYAYRKAPTGTYTSLFGDKLEKITDYAEDDPTLFESDLNMEMKVLLDLYKGNEEVSKGHRILIYDIETSTKGGFPNIMLGDKPITAIALYDYTTDKYYSLILDPKKKVLNKINGNEILKSFVTEPALLLEFLRLWQELNPTIITGWNNSLFDDPYIYNRIKNVLSQGAASRLSPLKIVYQNPFNRKMTIAGINSLDYIELYKKWVGVMKSSFALVNVAKDEELKHQKLTYKGNLDDLYENDINRFIEYNLQDVKCIYDLNLKYDFINLAISVCTKGKIPYEWFRMSSRFIDGAILDYLHVNNLVGPNKPIDGRALYEEMEKGDEDGFEGAFVKEPVKGLYSNVCSCDITSLYPSVIMTLNISNETKLGVIPNWNWDEYNKRNLKEIKINDLVYTIDEFEKMISNYSVSISTNGVMYSLKKQGVIPAILERWFSERVHYRTLAGQYAKEGNKEKEEFYDRRQKREKIFLNSIYGSLGLPVARWYDKDNAAATTLSGQTIIKYGEKIVDDTYNTKLKSEKKEHTIYIDTDSLYMSTHDLGKFDNVPEDKMTEYTIKFVTEIADKINKFYAYMVPKVFNVSGEKNRIKITPDLIASKALFIAKKRYAYLEVFSMEKMREVKDKDGNIGKLGVKGIDVVRSSYPKFFKQVVKKIFEDILRGKDLSRIDEEIMEMEEKIPSIDAMDLAKTSSIKFISRKGDKNYNPKSRSIFEIVKGSPATAKSGNNHNDIVKLWKLDKQYDLIRHGDKAKWVYLLPNPYGIEQIALRGDDLDPDKLLSFVNEYIDKKRIYNSELKSKLLEIYSAIHRDLPNRGTERAIKLFGTEEW